MLNESWYSVNQIAEAYGVHHRTVRRWIREGKLDAVKLGGALRISGSALESAMK